MVCNRSFKFLKRSKIFYCPWNNQAVQIEIKDRKLQVPGYILAFKNTLRHVQLNAFGKRMLMGQVVNTIISNYWMRLSRIWRILQIKEGVIHRGRRLRWITPSEICRILHILRKPNSIIALLFIQNISSFLKEFRHYALSFSAHQI